MPGAVEAYLICPQMNYHCSRRIQSLFNNNNNNNNICGVAAPELFAHYRIHKHCFLTLASSGRLFLDHRQVSRLLKWQWRHLAEVVELRKINQKVRDLNPPAVIAECPSSEDSAFLQRPQNHNPSLVVLLFLRMPTS